MGRWMRAIAATAIATAWLANGSEARGRRSQRYRCTESRYDLTLLNNFTFYLDDPVHGDQNEQQDHRVITGVKAFQKRQSRWAGYAVENTYGVQIRNDDVSNLALIHTEHGLPLVHARSGLGDRDDGRRVR